MSHSHSPQQELKEPDMTDIYFEDAYEPLTEPTP